MIVIVVQPYSKLWEERYLGTTKKKNSIFCNYENHRLVEVFKVRFFLVTSIANECQYELVEVLSRNRRGSESYIMICRTVASTEPYFKDSKSECSTLT